VTILRTKVVVKRVSGDGGTATVETSTAQTGTSPTFAADSISTAFATSSDVNLVGEFTGAPIETAFLATEADAEAVAAYLAGVNSAYPQLAYIMLDNESETNLEVMRDIDLSDRIVATESVTGAELDSFVEQVEHRITNGGLKHELRVLVSSRARLTGIFADDADAADPDVFSKFTDTPPVGLTYAVFGY
jgi:hypothetical protein